MVHACMYLYSVMIILFLFSCVLQDEVKLDESNNSNSNSNIDIVGEPDSDDDTAPDRKDSIGLHRRDNVSVCMCVLCI